MKALFDNVSIQCSRITTKSYSTSFSLGIYFLGKRFHNPIYSIYGFVRFADEIVDSFEGFDKALLLEKFKKDTFEAIEQKISLNPILNSFQATVHAYNIELELITIFLKSMEMDLSLKVYNRNDFDNYVLGSAEVVGLMCLRVFTNGNTDLYDRLKHKAKKLGAAFQKVNFLRDLNADYDGLGRSYFPALNINSFNNLHKKEIEAEIEKDFNEALKGIMELPADSRKGVYLAYVYYKALFNKIKKIPAERVIMERIRIPNFEKFRLMLLSLVFNRINI